MGGESISSTRSLLRGKGEVDLSKIRPLPLPRPKRPARPLPLWGMLNAYVERKRVKEGGGRQTQTL